MRYAGFNKSPDTPRKLDRSTLKTELYMPIDSVTSRLPSYEKSMRAKPRSADTQPPPRYEFPPAYTEKPSSPPQQPSLVGAANQPEGEYNFELPRYKPSSTRNEFYERSITHRSSDIRAFLRENVEKIPRAFEIKFMCS